MRVVRLPMSRKKAWASLQIGPKVSMATGAKRYWCDKAVYLAVLGSAAASAAAPAVTDVLARYDSATVSAIVTSQVMECPSCQGTSVSPSGLFPSALSRPFGSLAQLVAGTPARTRVRYMKSLT